MNLYQIAENHNQALMTMADIDGLDETVINDTMDMLEGEVRDKAVSVAGFFLNIEAEIAAMKNAERDIAERRKAKEKQVSWMKNYLLENMLRTGITKIDSPYFKIGLSTNPEAVHVLSEEMIPAEFITTTVTKAPNKALIKLAGGCPGVEIRRGHSVVIK